MATDEMIDAAGPLQFARFALPPNRLGHCGPDDVGGFAAAAAAGPAAEIAAFATAFDGAYPYLELIAAANRITDPLDVRVVEAYWIGNQLLWRVDVSVMVAALEDRFRRRAGSGWGALLESVPAGAAPHHSFHVFGVYPWVGLLRNGEVDHPLRVLDRCRIRWGRVEHVDGDHAVVTSRPLTWDGRVLSHGEPEPEEMVWAAAGASLLERPEPGDVVALHWDWVCAHLDRDRLANLRWWTQRHLDIVNTMERPAPAHLLG
jgi:hypothetical protein